MKRKRNIILIVLLMVTGNLLAQTKKKQTNFYFIPQAVLLNGDHSASGQVQFTGGLEKKDWYVGMGIAVDYYKIRTVPVFADIRYVFGKNKSFFSYTDVGYNMAWPLESQYRTTWLWTEPAQKSSFGNGAYADLGLGYTLTHKKNKGVLVSLGYSVKTITERYYQNEIRDFPPYTPTKVEHTLNYTFNRIALKIGYCF